MLTACPQWHTSSGKAACPKGPINSPINASNREPNIQIRKPMGHSSQSSQHAFCMCRSMKLFFCMLYPLPNFIQPFIDFFEENDHFKNHIFVKYALQYHWNLLPKEQQIFGGIMSAWIHICIFGCVTEIYTLVGIKIIQVFMWWFFKGSSFFLA